MANEKNLDRKILRQKHEKGGWIGHVLAVMLDLLVTFNVIARSKQKWCEPSLVLKP